VAGNLAKIFPSERNHDAGNKAQQCNNDPQMEKHCLELLIGHYTRLPFAELSSQGRRAKMKQLMVAILLTVFAVGSAAAQAPGTCESKAIDKNGKALAGAAKTSVMNKCKREACEPKAVGSDGKPLKGAAKNSFMAKCQREQA